MNQERCINKKPLSQAKDEFQVSFEKGQFKTDDFGHTYLPKPLIKERLDKTVSIFNYDFITGEPNFVEVAGKPHVVVNCCLTLYDDLGTKIVSKGLSGAAQIIVSNNTGSPVNVSNDIESATADAFKRICKWLGIGETQLSELSGKKNGNSKGNNKGSNKSSDPETQVYTIKLKGSFSSMGKDGLFASCEILGTDEPGEASFVLWADAQKLIVERMKYDNISQFTKAAVPGKEYTIIGYEKVYRGNRQVIMTGFVDR